METIDALQKHAESIQMLISAISNDTRVMTCSEAAYLLKKTPQTISRYIAMGKLHRASAFGVNGVRAQDVYMLMLK